MPTTIESLELEVQSSSTSATSGIDALSTSLSKLKNAVKGGVGLTSVTNQLKGLNAALQGIDSSAAGKLDTFSNSLSKLSGLGNIKISSSIGNQLKNIGSAATSLNGVDFSGIGKLSTALQPLSSLGKSNLTSFITQLGKLPQLAQTLQNMNMAQFTAQIQQLANALAPLANQLNTVSTAFSRLPANMRSTVSATNSLTTANNTAALSYANLWAKYRMAMNVVKTGARTIATWITQSNSYIENLNLFTASMGEYAAEAQKYAEQVGNVMGIDPGEWMRNQGIFMTITKGFGVASDRAYTMSQNLTQLGYDISSFFNISFADAMQKLESGISGELEPLRRLGYDLSQARLQQEAWNLGIDKSITKMTQAEKSELRYYAIMTQVTTAQGDMARTLNAPANQLRVLQAHVTQCARALGNIFIPALNAILPYAIAVAKVIRMLADTIASFFGFELPKVDYSSLSAGSSALGDMADSAGDTAGGLGDATKAAKKLKNALLGIDELNVISKNDDSGGSGSGSGAGGGIGGGGGLGFELPTYDFMGDLVNAKVDEIVQMIKGAMSEITAVVSGFLLAIGTILVVTGANIPLGLGLMAVGAVGLAATIAENWNGMSERLAKTLTIITATLGGFLLAIGAFLLFSGVNVPLGAGLMVAGAVSLGTALAINWHALDGDMKNTLSILTAVVSGALLAMGALFAFTGVAIPLGIALMVAGAASLATAVGLNWDCLSPKVKGVITAIEAIVGGGLLALGAIQAFTGVNIPLGIAMMAAGAISLASAVALNWDSLSGDTRKAVSTITTIVSGALIGIGAVLAFTGVATPLGIAMIAAGAVGLAATVGLNWESLTGKVKEVLKALGITVGAALLALGVVLALTGVALPLGIALIAAGAVGIVAGVALNWDTITTKIKGVLKKIGIIAGAAMLALGVLLCLTGVGIPLGIALIAAGAVGLVSGVALNWDTIKEKVGSGLKAISDKFGEFKGWVSEKLDGAKETIKTWASNTKEWFTKGKDGKGIIDHFKDTGEKIVGGFLDKVEEKYPGTKSKLAEWSAKTKEWFTKGEDGKGLVENFKETAGNVVSGFKDKIGSTYTNVKSNVTTWASNVKDWFSSPSFGGINSTSFGTFANNTIEGFKTKIGTAYTNTKSNITTWASKAKEWFTSSSFGGVNSSSFQTFANNTIEGFKTKIGNAYTNTKSNITTWASNVKTWFTNNGYGGINNTNWQTFANNVLEGFKSKIGSAYVNTKSNITTWASNVKSWFSNIASNSVFSEFATNVINGFKSKIGSYYTTAKSNMTTFGSSIKNWFTDNVSYSKFYDVASNVIDGFKNGIGNLYTTCKNTITSWGSSIISWFKEKLGIKSPSKVFYQMGDFTIEGFNNAISTEGKSTKGIMSAWSDSFTDISPKIALAVDTSAVESFDPSKVYARALSAEVQGSCQVTADGFVEGMEKFYRDYVEPTLNRIADDTKRQADKEEQTIVQVGNRTVTDAVTTQKKANGYVFAT